MSSKKAEARERVKAMRAEQARKERRRERMMRFGIAGAVIVAVAIIAVAVTVTRNGDDGGPVALPDTVSEEGEGITFGDAEAPVTLDIWVDFLCPHCKDFEDQNASTINELVESGDAKVTYHPVTYTGRNYSSRANNAFACAVDAGSGQEYFDELFVAPEQWSDNDLINIGESVGLGGEFEDCVRNDTYDDWSSSVTDATNERDDVGGTPTVHVNGEVLENWSPSAITQAVTAAAQGGSADQPAGQSTGQPTGQPTEEATS